MAKHRHVSPVANAQTIQIYEFCILKQVSVPEEDKTLAILLLNLQK